MKLIPASNPRRSSVSLSVVPGLIRVIPMLRSLPHPVPVRRAFSLIELLCVFAIIGILVGMLLGPAGRALNKARRLKTNTEAPIHVERLTDGMRRFARTHLEYQCPDLEALLLFANPGSPTERWLKSQATAFQPFTHHSPDDFPVLSIDISQGPSHVLRFTLTKRDLTKTPD